MPHSWPCMGGEGGAASVVCDFAIALPSNTAKTDRSKRKRIDFIVTPGRSGISGNCVQIWKHGAAQDGGKESVNRGKVLSKPMERRTPRPSRRAKRCVSFDNSLPPQHSHWCTITAAMERILVIDDDVELCHLVGEYLQAEGFTTECVHDGESGLKKANDGEYLLAVLDVM